MEPPERGLWQNGTTRSARIRSRPESFGVVRSRSESSEDSINKIVGPNEVGPYTLLLPDEEPSP